MRFPGHRRERISPGGYRERVEIGTKRWYHLSVNTKQCKTLELLFIHPTPADIARADIESLFRALDAEIREGAGSRVRVKVNGVPAVFHVPHPRRRIAQGRIRAIRAFLEDAGVQP